MSLRQRLTVWRRRRCLRRGHPMADWSPHCVSYKFPDQWVGGVFVRGPELYSRAWRCARHDPPPKRLDISIDLCR